jgi:hypothetical protein
MLMKVGILITLSAIAIGLIPLIGESGFSQGNGNITAPVVPQGTSIGEASDNSTENQTESRAGNITAPVVPQGTSIGEASDNSTENQTESRAGNITAPVVPQGTSIGEASDNSTEN